MSLTIDALELEIDSNAGQAVSGIDSLVASLGRIQSVTAGVVSGLRKVNNQIKKLTGGLSALPKFSIDTSGIDSAVAPIKEAISSISESAGLSDLKTVIIDATPEIDVSAVTQSAHEATEAIRETFSNMPDIEVPVDVQIPTSEISEAANEASAAGRTISQRISEGFQSFKTSGIAAAFSSIADKAKSTGESIKDTFKNAAASATSAFKGVTSRIGAAFSGIKSSVAGVADTLKKKFNPAVTSGTSGLSKFFASLKRIALYRAVRAILRGIANALKEGISNLYQYSKALGGEFAASMDSISTSAQYLKNSLGAVAAPLINALAPAIEYLVDKFVSLLNVINQVFALLSGAATFTKATKQAKEYADATTGAAESLKSFTTGIDELNVLDTSAAGGGGRGSCRLLNDV